MTGREKPNLSLSFPMIQSATSPAILELSLSSKALWSFCSHGHRRYCQPLPGTPVVASLFLSLPSPDPSLLNLHNSPSPFFLSQLGHHWFCVVFNWVTSSSLIARVALAYLWVSLMGWDFSVDFVISFVCFILGFVLTTSVIDGFAVLLLGVCNSD